VVQALIPFQARSGGPDRSDPQRLLFAGATGKELKRLTSTSLHSAAFSPDGKRLVSGGYLDSTVRVWDAETGRELRKCEGHTGAVLSVTFFPDGKRIASASADGSARIWRAPADLLPR
jgi:WD40 repeat protein